MRALPNKYPGPCRSPECRTPGVTIEPGAGSCVRVWTGRRVAYPLFHGACLPRDEETALAWYQKGAPASAVRRPTRAPQGARSDLFVIGGNEYVRNRAGRCEDAPCCGCCTI